jgi:hypothetical protein
MKRLSFKTFLIIVVVGLSVLSYIFLNCCASERVEAKLLKHNAQIEQVDKEGRSGVGGELKVLLHVLEIARKVLPAS